MTKRSVDINNTSSSTAVKKKKATATVSCFDSTSGHKRWYVVHVRPGYEDKFKSDLEYEVKLKNLEHLFGELIIPTEDVVEMKAGKRVTCTKKFFPGYVMLEMDLNDKTWYLVTNLPRVLGFITGAGERPISIEPKEIESIRDRMKTKEGGPRHIVSYNNGEVIRITDGPFSDFTGVVESVNYEKNKVKVSVSIFGRLTPVELDFEQVKKG